VFLKLFCSIAPFSLSTRRCGPQATTTKTQGSIFKEFYLKKSIHTMVPSSVWWMWLAAFTKLRNLGRHFSEVVVDHLAYESTSLFFALRVLRSQPKLTQLSLTPWSICDNGWTFPTFVLFFPAIAPLLLKIAHMGTIPPTVVTTELEASRRQTKDCLWIINFNNLLTQGLQQCL